MNRRSEIQRLVKAHGLVLGRRTHHGFMVVDPDTGATVAHVAGTPGGGRGYANLRATLARHRKETS